MTEARKAERWRWSVQKVLLDAENLANSRPTTLEWKYKCKQALSEKAMATIPVLLPGKSHGQRSLVGYSPWGRKELDMTEVTSMHALSINLN